MSNKIVSETKLKEYDELINNDKNIPDEIKQNTTLRELCRAGLWLEEELKANNCPENLLTRIQVSAGRYAFGRDVWDACRELLEMFINNELKIEIESAELN